MNRILNAHKTKILADLFNNLDQFLYDWDEDNFTLGVFEEADRRAQENSLPLELDLSEEILDDLQEEGEKPFCQESEEKDCILADSNLVEANSTNQLPEIVESPFLWKEGGPSIQDPSKCLLKTQIDMGQIAAVLKTIDAMANDQMVVFESPRKMDYVFLRYIDKDGEDIFIRLIQFEQAGINLIVGPMTYQDILRKTIEDYNNGITDLSELQDF